VIKSASGAYLEDVLLPPIGVRASRPDVSAVWYWAQWQGEQAKAGDGQAGTIPGCTLRLAASHCNRPISLTQTATCGHFAIDIVWRI
jgi:hypothetical protein